ncbi:glutathione S transferase [Penicillium argentinense]|uniref:Glutathione S transferase n=1 Tax=Penicillium argentinense TaxID=1131581 RepID=A0A9W9EJK1_9EURO|nr:glutathione S transferase [Penicillium argentinense]KAJ5082895.1 glutathione S transferase [Penicillium argentinense]
MATQEHEYQLIGLHTRYSSWTSRVEAVLEYFQIPYNPNFVKIDDVKAVSRTGLVPVLESRSLGSTPINDSLAICEFLAESHPEFPLWPRDRLLRALARSAAAQMHSGFSALRGTFHTNFVVRYTGNIHVSAEAQKDVEKILVIWDSSRKATKERLAILGEVDEGFLFGGFSIADAFFWPVLWRFRTYNLPLDTASKDALTWMAKMWNDPVFRGLGDKYFEQANDPDTAMPHYDNIFPEQDDIQRDQFPQDWTFSVSGK